VQGRPKYTGFEKIDHSRDSLLRKRLRAHIQDDGDLYSSRTLMVAPQTDDVEPCIERYRSSLVTKAKQFSNDKLPIVYYSGGADSEVMVKAFQEAGVEFQIVTFVLTSSLEFLSDAPEDIHHDGIKTVLPDDQVLVNSHDIKYALNYCQEQGLYQTLRLFNVEKFWDSAYIYKLAEQTGLSSPQILCQRFMSKLVEGELRDLGPNSLRGNNILYYHVDYAAL
jgi:hypothetical protein